ncbi:MAG: dockerin type I domain-containing protein [Saprospiraceae bacterium]
MKAAHIIGGDVNYQCISSNAVAQTTTFSVSFTLYRDVLGGGANFDINAQFGVYRREPSSNNWFFVQTIISNPTNITNVPLNDPCVIVPPNIRVERGSYHFNVTLPWDDNVYQIAYQRCCRNNSIDNIINPGGTGAVFSIDLYQPAIRNCNNSAVFKQFPPIIVCTNRPLQFDHGTTDIEGDSVVYSFCVPITSGGMVPGDDCNAIVPAPFKCLPPFPEVVYNPPYTFTTPMLGNPLVSINPETGLISGTPNLSGQFVVGICIEEYRNGELLNKTRRDFQFNVRDCAGITYNQNVTLCENDTLDINGTIYTESGTFTQNFITEAGCDSILVLNIKELSISEKILNVKICAPNEYDFFGTMLSTSGTYTKTLTNNVGCDSTIILHLVIAKPSSGYLEFSLCDEEIIEVNNETYHQSGTYIQYLTNTNGCDSTLNIIISKGFSSSTTQYYSFCNGNDFVINGILYDVPGHYVQDLQSQTGCDSLLIIVIVPCDQNVLYDFQLCDALTPQQSMNYAEFTPTYHQILSCGDISASNIQREIPQENKHSCTQGHESSLSMCVGVSKSCNPEEADQKPVVMTFEANPEEGSFIKWNHLTFFHNAPTNYNWVNGANGPNNFPTKIRLRIFKNGQLLHDEQDIPTINSWSKKQLDLFENPEFLLDKGDSIRIEILPYCPAGNGAIVSVWDIDNLALYFSCDNKNNRTISGTIPSSLAIPTGIEIKRYEGQKVLIKQVDNSQFSFPVNDPFTSYYFKGWYNKNTSEGVSTFDIVLIQRHILGIESFSNPMQYVAADVNHDGKINSIDLIELRKVILGLYEFFPSNTSWRFIPTKNIYSNPNPLTWDDRLFITPGYDDVLDLEFVPVKIGDIDGMKNNSIMDNKH